VPFYFVLMLSVNLMFANIKNFDNKSSLLI